jgi:DNA-directed RNA polymerase subunit L
MELKIIENTKNRLVFEIPGADHTLCNALKKELVETKGVEIATYAIEHPQIGIPKMILETSGALTPKKALESAVAGLKDKNKEFLKAFSKVK